MHLFHTYHAHADDFRKLAHSKFWQFEISVWLHTFSRALIAIFIPILLLDLGYELMAVLVYYLIYHLMDIPLNFFAGWFIRKFSARWGIVTGIIFEIAFFVLLYNLTVGSPFFYLVLLAAFAALFDSFYWTGTLFLFIKYDEGRGDVDKDTSFFYIVRRVASVLAPAVGAAVLVLVSKQALIGVAIFFFLLSAWPLFHLRKEHEVQAEPRVPLRQFLSHPRERRDYFSRALYGIHHTTELVLWPLFIYVLFGTIESVAYIPIIVSLTTIIFAYFTGNISKKGRGKLMMLGAVSIALVWILRLTIASTVLYYASVFLVGLFTVLVTLPMNASMFERAKRIGALSAMTYRNAFSMSLRALVYIAMILALGVFEVGFVTAMIAMFALLLVNWFFLQKYALESQVTTTLSK